MGKKGGNGKKLPKKEEMGKKGRNGKKLPIWEEIAEKGRNGKKGKKREKMTDLGRFGQLFQRVLFWFRFTLVLLGLCRARALFPKGMVLQNNIWTKLQ